MQPIPELSLRFLPRELPVRVVPEAPLDDVALYDLCLRNPDLRIERTAAGDLIVMPPTGGESGRKNASLVTDLTIWARRDGSGLVFDSSTGFVLANGAERAPDAAWLRRSRWDALTDEERERFPPLCPDFVVEVRSRTDRLEPLHDKMREYVANGAQLGWLVDPYGRVVWVYRVGGAVDRLDAPEHVTGDPVLPGFVLSTAVFW